MLKKSLDETIKLQKIASNPRNSAWVFASAGSGKTKILVDRVLRFLLDGVAANKILCITFTKIAASEMQERISKRLSQWLLMDDEVLREEIFALCDERPDAAKLELARSLFAMVLDDDSAIKIQTIHAFCQTMMQIFPFEAQISPNFEILDEKSEKIMLERAKNEIFVKARFDDNLYEQIESIAAKLSDDGILELLSEILNKKERLIFLKEKFGNVENLVLKIFLDLGLGDLESEEGILQNFKKNLNFAQIDGFFTELSLSKKKTDVKMANLWQKFAKNDDIFSLKEIFYKKDGKKRAKIVTKEFFDDFLALNLLQKIDDFFDLLNSFRIAKNTEILLNFVDKILQKYEEIKQENAVLDYNDLIIKTNQLLRDEKYSDWVKFRMDGFFDHILVDESQDTNQAQWTIIKALSEDFFSGEGSSQNQRSLFIIGDEKQSIYGFQGAKAGISNEIFDFYKQKTDKIQRVNLQNSFRSLPEILAFVDKVFVEKGDALGREYCPHQAIRQGRGKVEIWPKIEAKKDEKNDDLAWKNYTDDENFFGEEFCQKEEMARFLAKKILKMVQSHEIQALDNGERGRKVRFGDFMILLRNRANGFDKVLQSVFEEENIALKGSKRISCQDSLIIQDFMALARFVLLPQDDLNLACLLKSPFFCVSEEELFELCNCKNEAEIDLFSAIKMQENGEIWQKLQKILEIYQNNDFFEFFWQNFDENIKENFRKEFGAIFEVVLEQFLLLTLDLLQKEVTNLEEFVNYIDSANPDISVVDASLDDAVTLSTIHSAKGLQAPIVILPDCSFVFNKMRALKQKLFWLKMEGEGFEDLEMPIWLAKSSEANNLVRKQKEIEAKLLKDEYWRLFYVALTRAENELYITGFGGDGDVDCWYDTVSNIKTLL